MQCACVSACPRFHLTLETHAGVARTHMPGVIDLSRKQWRAQRGHLDDGEWAGLWTMCIEATAPPPPPAAPLTPSPPLPPPAYPVAHMGGMLQGVREKIQDNLRHNTLMGMLAESPGQGDGLVQGKEYRRAQQVSERIRHFSAKFVFAKSTVGFMGRIDKGAEKCVVRGLWWNWAVNAADGYAGGRKDRDCR